MLVALGASGACVGACARMGVLGSSAGLFCGNICRKCLRVIESTWKMPLPIDLRAFGALKRAAGRKVP